MESSDSAVFPSSRNRGVSSHHSAFKVNGPLSQAECSNVKLGDSSTTCFATDFGQVVDFLGRGRGSRILYPLVSMRLRVESSIINY